MGSLEITQDRVLHPLATPNNISYIKVYRARDTKHNTHYTGMGFTKREAIKDLGRWILNSTSREDMTGRFEQGFKYSNL